MNETTRVAHREIDFETWPRRGHFEFFSGYEEPFFSITAEVECTRVIAEAGKSGRSKTFSLWHGILKAGNAVEEFRSRILDQRPVLYDIIHLSPTVLRPDGTFAIAFVPYLEDYEEFALRTAEIVEQAKRTRGFDLDPSTRRIDLFHFSTVPWFRFSGVHHARSLSTPGSEPKITIGKFGPRPGGGLGIPVSVTGHHGLMDGYHVAKFLQQLENLWA